jgi:hypothetical protein
MIPSQDHYLHRTTQTQRKALTSTHIQGGIGTDNLGVLEAEYDTCVLTVRLLRSHYKIYTIEKA